MHTRTLQKDMSIAEREALPM